MSIAEPEIIRWYTKARRFPKLIGKTPEGRAIWGGPYTQTQFVVGVVLLFLMSKTTGLWGHFGLLGNIAVALGVSYGATWGLGKLPLGARNPFAIAAGGYAVLMAPHEGRFAGRRVTVPKPTRARSRVTIAAAPLLDLTPAPDPARVSDAESSAASETEPVMRRVDTHPMSTVQQLLAASTLAKE